MDTQSKSNDYLMRYFSAGKFAAFTADVIFLENKYANIKACTLSTVREPVFLAQEFFESLIQSPSLKELSKLLLIDFWKE